MKKILLIFIMMLFAGNAFSFGPFYVYPDGSGGQAYKWKGDTLDWQYENNRLSEKALLLPTDASCPKVDSDCSDLKFSACSEIKKCGILVCLEYVMCQWQSAHVQNKNNDIVTTKVKIKKIGAITPSTKDINGENILSYYENSKKNGIGYIIFDEDGTIYDKLNQEDGTGIDHSLLGITIPWRPAIDAGRPSEPYYSGAIMILNGRYFDGKNDNGEITSQELGSTLIHEVGHMLGLDHTQPLRSVMGSEPGSKPASDKEQGMPTMYPIIVTEGQLSLHVDDVMGVSYLYPNDNYHNKLCKAEGVIKDLDSGKEMQGVNVLIHAKDTEGGDDYIDSRSFVSGALYVGGKNKGGYILPGLIPEKEYVGVIEAIHEDFKEGFAGGINPYGNSAYPCDGPDQYELDSDTSITMGGDSVIKCSLPTSTDTPIPTINLGPKEVKLGECGEGEDCGGSSDSDGKKKGWCMSISGTVNPALSLAYIPAIALGIYLLRRRKNK